MKYQILKRLRSGLLLAGTVALAAFCTQAANIGESFPDLHRFGLEGPVPDLKGKVVLIDFFASWCGPCKQSFPVMREIEAKYKDKGLVVIAVNVDKKRTDMEKFLDKQGVTFTVLRDVSAKLISEVKVSSMPSSFLLDAQGKVVAVHSGFRGAETKAQYVREIEALLAK